MSPQQNQELFSADEMGREFRLRTAEKELGEARERDEKIMSMLSRQGETLSFIKMSVDGIMPRLESGSRRMDEQDTKIRNLENFRLVVETTSKAVNWLAIRAGALAGGIVSVAGVLAAWLALRH